MSLRSVQDIPEGGARRRNFVKEKVSRRPAREVQVYVGGWRVLGHQGKRQRASWETEVVFRLPDRSKENDVNGVSWRCFWRFQAQA